MSEQEEPKGKYQSLDGSLMWDWYSIDIKEIDGSKYVYFYSKIHVNRVVEMPVCYSTKFTDQEILKDRDLVTQVINRYGNVWKK